MTTLDLRDALHDRLLGEVISPTDDGYDEARALYNGMIDKRPELIVRCRDVADVISAVEHARESGLPLAIRAGGHNGAGLGSCDGGLVIDLSGLRSVRVDPDRRTVRVDAGCTNHDVDHATHPFGLAVPAGIVASTGVAGLTLGGGHGYLTRQHGLTIDNLLEADVVLADGRFVTASETCHPDLFWALRGGGGNFGVVTSFVFRAHPVSTVYGGPIFWDLEHGGELMRRYREILPTLPERCSPFLGLKSVPSTAPFPTELWGRRIAALVLCHDGPAEDAAECLAPLRDELPPPLLDGCTTMPFPALQSMFDPLLPAGLQWYWKGDFVRDLPDEAVDAHLEHAAQSPTEASLMHLYPVDGAPGRVAPDATAFHHRDATWSMVIAGISAEPAQAGAITSWARAYWEAVHPHTLGGAYVNFMMEEGPDRVRATYGPNHDRLAAVKAEYDPTNLFRVNQNIAPAGDAAAVDGTAVDGTAGGT
jgi:FAD/FMN-containing dehydrogenase